MLAPESRDSERDKSSENGSDHSEEEEYDDEWSSGEATSTSSRKVSSRDTKMRKRTKHSKKRSRKLPRSKRQKATSPEQADQDDHTGIDESKIEARADVAPVTHDEAHNPHPGIIENTNSSTSALQDLLMAHIGAPGRQEVVTDNFVGGAAASNTPGLTQALALQQQINRQRTQQIIQQQQQQQQQQISYGMGSYMPPYSLSSAPQLGPLFGSEVSRLGLGTNANLWGNLSSLGAPLPQPDPSFLYGSHTGLGNSSLGAVDPATLAMLRLQTGNLNVAGLPQHLLQHPSILSQHILPQQQQQPSYQQPTIPQQSTSAQTPVAQRDPPSRASASNPRDTGYAEVEPTIRNRNLDPSYPGMASIPNRDSSRDPRERLDPTLTTVASVPSSSASQISNDPLIMPSCAALAPDGYPFRLPAVLARPDDTEKLSSHQVLLRYQIEVFQATADDINTHTRGRNKPITLNQVGIRCRHCSDLPVAQRRKGSTYFPASLMGIYQAAQNMCTTHMQCGLCHKMPDEIKNMFARLLSTKLSSTGAGRQAWAQSGQKLGLVDTSEGMYFIRDVPPRAEILPANFKSK